MREKCYIIFRRTHGQKDTIRTQKFVPLAIVFSFYTGLRNGELSALKFSDIHASGVVIQRMVNDNKDVVNRTKTGASRTVELVPEAVKVIEEVKRRRLELGLPIDGYIFAIDDSPYKTYYRIKVSVGQYCKELGLKIRSHHDIRRTFISKCIAEGYTLKEVMDMAGHRDYNTTINSYIKNIYCQDERVKRLADALDF